LTSSALDRYVEDARIEARRSLAVSLDQVFVGDVLIDAAGWLRKQFGILEIPMEGDITAANQPNVS
jgi:hypothetical protein